MIVEIVAQGDQGHAGYASASSEFTNAASVLARDLLKLDALFNTRSPCGCGLRRGYSYDALVFSRFYRSSATE